MYKTSPHLQKKQKTHPIKPQNCGKAIANSKIMRTFASQLRNGAHSSAG
jgi:hypothetical protein